MLDQVQYDGKIKTYANNMGQSLSIRHSALDAESS